ncbi:MAG: acetylxylan esterase [Paludisphaera borealis]|uniref:alpha/beta hydrolase family protein n=1 Tax=Paludisphaera borealis TaxID=1387353 RepID=UPI0028492C7F|nr:acetylxylan esterase [Paludisphaera borealis]MDR3621493.1 acetylxylan esterase [Paludisphaera borealis]
MRAFQGSDAAREQYPAFVRDSAPSARRPTVAPSTLAGWDARLRAVADGLRDSFGQVPDHPCDLEPEILGVLARPGYVIERLTFQSRPGVRVTANLYRPEQVDGRAAGVLCVHGHWKWARIDPVVQTRCIGLARLGYVCLCVDAFGAGERAVAPGPGTYHGGMLGASLWSADVPLIGLQVYDNRRAVDYLISRPEVDPTQLAITGASGGGNQSLYAGATDDRFKAVVPVCGVGTYEAYLQAACCVCEVNPGGLSYGLTGDLLAMIAPRALLVISASHDARQFSVEEAAKSLAYARSRFNLLNADDHVRHLPIESGHDYNKQMREAMYGWLDRWLRGRGDGSPVPEPEIHPEDPADLRCYPFAASRPASVVTIPVFAHRESLARLAALPPAPDHRQAWEAEAIRIKAMLRDHVLGGLPVVRPPLPIAVWDAKEDLLTIETTTEAGLTLTGLFFTPKPCATSRGTAIVIQDSDLEPASARERCKPWTDAGYAACCVELRATGKRKPNTPAVAGAADHNEAEWAVWLGRPLLGQWVWDVLQWMEVVSSLVKNPPKNLGPTGAGAPLVLDATGPIGVVPILAGAFDARVQTVCVDHGLVSYAPPDASFWTEIPMGLIAPKLLRYGDIGTFGALLAPRRLVVIGGVETTGGTASEERLKAAFAFTKSVYGLFSAGDSLELATSRAASRLLPRAGSGG